MNDYKRLDEMDCSNIAKELCCTETEFKDRVKRYFVLGFSLDYFLSLGDYWYLTI